VRTASITKPNHSYGDDPSGPKGSHTIESSSANLE